MWPQGAGGAAGATAAASQYQGRQMRGSGNNYKGQYQSRQGGGSRGSDWGSNKRPRWGAYREESWNEEAYGEEAGYEDEDQEDEDWDGHGHSDHKFMVPAPKRRLPRPKPKPKPLSPPPEEEDDIDLVDPMLTMKMEVVEVPKKYIAKIIGKKGSQIRLIRDETGAHIDARDQTEDPCRVKVLGTPEAIEAARKKIFDIIEQSIHKPGLVVEIPRAKIGKVIGIRGAQIHQIQTTTGAKVDVDKDVDPCRVTIGGTDVQIAMAEKVILTLAMEAADQESEYLELPSQVSGAVLGVRGARLMELQAASGARIDVDKTRPATCRVRIAGTPDQIELAKQLVLLATEAPRPTEAALLAAEGVEQQPTDSSSASVDLPPGTAGKIIGRNGATIQSVQSETGARVWVDCEASQARISGAPGAVEHALLLIQALSEEAEAEIQETERRAAASSTLAASAVPDVLAMAAAGVHGGAAAATGPAESGWEGGGEQGSWGASSWAAWSGQPAQGQGQGDSNWPTWAPGAAEGSADQSDYWAAGWPEESGQAQASQQDDAWNWQSGEASGAQPQETWPAPHGAAAAEQGAEDAVQLPSMVRPQTAMQRAFALLAAKSRAP